MVAAYFVFLAAVLAIAFFADWRQCFRHRDQHISLALAKLRPAARWAVYYLLIGCILAGAVMQSGGFGTVSFAYAGF